MALLLFVVAVWFQNAGHQSEAVGFVNRQRYAFGEIDPQSLAKGFYDRQSDCSYGLRETSPPLFGCRPKPTTLSVAPVTLSAWGAPDALIQSLRRALASGGQAKAVLGMALVIVLAAVKNLLDDRDASSGFPPQLILYASGVAFGFLLVVGVVAWILQLFCLAALWFVRLSLEVFFLYMVSIEPHLNLVGKLNELLRRAFPTKEAKSTT